MAKKRKGNGRPNGKQWFTTSEAARYLDVSVDKVRQLDQSGDVRASRTQGKHRRFARRTLDAYLARKGRRSWPKVNRPKPRPRPIAPQPDPEQFDDDGDAFEPGDEDFEPFVEPPPPPPPPNPFETLERERAERRKREAEEAPLRRLATLKQYGLGQVPYGTPDMWRAKVASALEGFVTLKTFPSWINDTEAYRIVRGKVDEVLQPYQEEVAHKKAEDARKHQEWLDERRVQQLVEYGKSYASSKMGWDWESDDRARALRDVERVLQKEAEAGWTEQDVRDAVDDELAKWEDEDDEDDEDEVDDEDGEEDES
ncbi:MAG: excisionase family DNA-binding protein [Gemmatimonadales bacterium]|nr:excisionase family DNA-binding protein [Gemmatimonadales bacterium]